VTVIALDVGGTHIKGAVVADDGALLHAERWFTRPGRGADALVDTVLGCASDLTALAGRSGREPAAAGLVVPGVVDETAGRAVSAAALDWRDTPLRQWLAEHLGLPVAFGHDVRAGGRAEARLGAGRGCRSFAFVRAGTSVAATLMVDGRPLTGGPGGAADLGHLVVRPGGAPCHCGNRGCLETLASSTAIARHYRQAGGRPGATARDVQLAASTGEPIAARVWTQTVEALSDALATLTALLDPERIVLGGSLAAAGEPLFAALTATAAARSALRTPPPIVPAALGHQAGCLGAALLAQDLLSGRQPCR